jgi:hypothetical protein
MEFLRGQNSSSFSRAWKKIFPSFYVNLSLVGLIKSGFIYRTLGTPLLVTITTVLPDMRI